MLASVQHKFMEHPYEEVRLAVASCHSEIIRITAPVALYNDDMLKKVLLLIVESLKGLHDVKTPTFGKRAKILEIMARTRSFILMLDFQCDKLILQMFHCFIVVIRKCHLDKVRSDMFDILSMILDQNDEVCKQLWSDLLGNWRRKLHVSTVAYNLTSCLVERKIEKFNEVLTKEEIRSLGFSISRSPKKSKNQMRKEHVFSDVRRLGLLIIFVELIRKKMHCSQVVMRAELPLRMIP
ncbi:hypothetical protein SUGI_1172100 [Cryptomeria japonica]|nr:hypothetical protein SUGI_1172100 [Cryptomeria japonica]